MDESDRCSLAERLYAEFLGSEEEGDALAFETFAEAHPEQRAELQRMWEIDRATRGSSSTLFFRPELLKPTAAESVARIVEPEPGSSLGPYELIRKIGQGGMGQVWEAHERGLDRRVALKLMKPGTIPKRALEFFEREARACARVQHPGVVVAHAAGEIDGVCYIAEELIESGVTLSDSLGVLRDLATVPPDYYHSAARLILQIADALVATHEAGVVHRDVKPGNILIAAEDRAVLTDFGLARILREESLSRTGEVAGTYAYMSPEQVAQERSIDPRTDVFSLGVVLYEALTLTRPFDGDTAQQVMHKILHEDPPDPRRVRSRVPADLDVICRKAMEKERGRRYASMVAFAADLRRFLGDEPIEARPPGVGQRAVKWAKRNPVKTAATALVTIALVVISALSVDLERTTRELGEEVISVKRLSALQDLEDLILEADTQLWPAEPDRIGAYRSWIERAIALVEDLPLHRAKREELVALIDATPDAELGVERWWEGQLAKLIERLEELSAEKTGLLGGGPSGSSLEHGLSVPRRLSLARFLEERLAPGSEWARRWEEARVAIEAHPSYGGLDLEVQVALVPIGPDPESGLWEFHHVATGEEPRRDAETGRLRLTEISGLVFVLIPGGRFLMGAQKADPDQAGYDPQALPTDGPVHEVALSPFFLSKYEATQFQWLQLSGTSPSHFCSGTYESEWNAAGREGDQLHPVEQVSWVDADLQLRRAGLTLPSEAQWEYATRAGTTTTWWPGDDPALLVDVGNVSDAYNESHGGEWALGIYEAWDDGQAKTAPVGSFRANAFGLHDVHGNVGELCLDGDQPGFYQTGPAVDPVAPRRSRCIIRGGSYELPSFNARSAHRGVAAVASGDRNLGIRPARTIRGSSRATPAREE